MMRNFINIVSESILNEAQDYSALFNPIRKRYSNVEPFFEYIISEAVKKTRLMLKKSNRVMWALKNFREMISDAIEVEGDNTASSIRSDVVQEYVNLLNKLEHFYSLEIDAINNLPIDQYSMTNAIEEMERLEEEWKSQANQYVEIDPEDKVYMTFPDGFAWVLLDRAGCRAEGNAMGHCGNMPSMKEGQRILSLRKKTTHGSKSYWRPSLTFILNKDGTLGEMKGRANEKPQPKYHPYIIALLKSDIITGIRGGGFAPKQNFHLSDLSSALSDDLRDSKPEIFEKVGLRTTEDCIQVINYFHYHYFLPTPEDNVAQTRLQSVDKVGEYMFSNLSFREAQHGVRSIKRCAKIVKGFEEYATDDTDGHLSEIVTGLGDHLKELLVDTINQHHSSVVDQFKSKYDKEFTTDTLHNFLEFTNTTRTEFNNEITYELTATFSNLRNQIFRQMAFDTIVEMFDRLTANEITNSLGLKIKIVLEDVETYDLKFRVLIPLAENMDALSRLYEKMQDEDEDDKVPILDMNDYHSFYLVRMMREATQEALDKYPNDYKIMKHIEDFIYETYD